MLNRNSLALGLAAALSVIACAAEQESPPAEQRSEIGSEPRPDPAVACPAPYDAPGHGPVAGTNSGFSAGGQKRSFELILPASSFTGPRPVFMAFHGTGEDAANFRRRAHLDELAARGFIVIAPDAVGNGALWPVWDGMHLHGTESTPNADLALVDQLLQCTSAHFEIDRTRIFAGGHSAGGIFTNHVLRSRSKVFAGGVVASGVFGFTTGASAKDPLDSMTVIVTWGGDNDGFGGGDFSGFTFVEEASLASKYFEAQPNVGQVYCRGNDLGHVWLPINSWFADVLLARPKGTPASSLVAPPLPAGARVTCFDGPFELPPLPQTACSAAKTSRDGCTEMCQLFTDCALENLTVGTALASELGELGLRPSQCAPCVERCGSIAKSPADAEVLACFKAMQATATCGPGLEGGMPLLTTIDTCCVDRRDSALCVDMCNMLNDSLAGPFLANCSAIVGSEAHWSPP